MENIFGVDCWDGCRQKWGSAKLLRYRVKEVLVEVVNMILWTSKGETERWNLTRAEERIFGGDCRGDYMHN